MPWALPASTCEHLFLVCQKKYFFASLFLVGIILKKIAWASRLLENLIEYFGQLQHFVALLDRAEHALIQWLQHARCVCRQLQHLDQ